MSMETIVKISAEMSQSIEQAFKDKMAKEYKLTYTDYRDHYEDNPQLIQKCLNKRCTDPLDESIYYWPVYEEASNVIENLKTEIIADKALSNLHDYVEDWISVTDNHDTIRYLVEERDISEPITEMVERTELRARATLYTNYDCLMHNYDMGNTYRYDEYFKDIVDVLYLNPALVKKTFNEKGIHTKGRWPDLSYRNGKEAVLYHELADEMLNQSCYGLLTFLGMLPISELHKNGFDDYTHILIPEGNLCGMFGHWQGGGSLLEMKLQRDLIIPVNRPRKTEHDTCEICVDECGCVGYSIDEVYGMSRSVWGKEFSLTFKI